MKQIKTNNNTSSSKNTKSLKEAHIEDLMKKKTRRVNKTRELSILRNSNKKPSIDGKEYIIEVNKGNLFYGRKRALKDISLNIEKGKVISIIGPSGCGKSTFLRCLNRMNDHIKGIKIRGDFIYKNFDIYATPGKRTLTIKNLNRRIKFNESRLSKASKKTTKVAIGKKLRNLKLSLDRVERSQKKFNSIHETELRKEIGMIFQKPNPFPMSIEKNVKYGPRINGINDKDTLDEITKKSLKGAGLWSEVKNRLWDSAESLSGGQQQRLCIARAIANSPEVLLMDEPTSSLDPIAAEKVEDLIHELKGEYTIVIVTHSMAQARRVSDYTAFFFEGELIEFDRTEKLFEKPQMKKTEEYISGRFG